MSWQNRQYAQEDNYQRTVGRRFRGSGMGAYDVVTKLIIANIVVYLFYYGPLYNFVNHWLVMRSYDVYAHGQVWRLFTSTYLHAPGLMHVGFNMLALYFFGPIVEHQWGGRQFFLVYTIGGIFGNVILMLASMMGFIHPLIPALGASGSVMAIMAAAAVLHPTTEVLFYFFLPLQLRTLVVVYAAGFVLNVWNRGPNFGGDLCHLGGLAVGWWWARTGGWAWAGGTPRIASAARPGLGSFFRKRAARAADFRARVAQRQVDANDVDRILAKVRERGIQCLSDEEKATLKAATERLNAHQAG